MEIALNDMQSLCKAVRGKTVVDVDGNTLELDDGSKVVLPGRRNVSHIGTLLQWGEIIDGVKCTPFFKNDGGIGVYIEFDNLLVCTADLGDTVAVLPADGHEAPEAMTVYVGFQGHTIIGPAFAERDDLMAVLQAIAERSYPGAELVHPDIKGDWWRPAYLSEGRVEPVEGAPWFKVAEVEVAV